MMDDLISRQAAINALMKRDKELRNINWYDKPFAEGECKGIDYALEIVNALPSVQPTQSNASNALKTLDCISRQQAIDAVEESRRLNHHQNGREACAHEHEHRHFLKILIDLPSVQPEPLSDAYTKAVWTWLLDYQIKAAKLKGRYTPYEVLSWVANDWRKEYEGSD